VTCTLTANSPACSCSSYALRTCARMLAASWYSCLSASVGADVSTSSVCCTVQPGWRHDASAQPGAAYTRMPVSTVPGSAELVYSPCADMTAADGILGAAMLQMLRSLSVTCESQAEYSNATTLSARLAAEQCTSTHVKHDTTCSCCHCELKVRCGFQLTCIASGS
jgi:hypothetical protein